MKGDRMGIKMTVIEDSDVGGDLTMYDIINNMLKLVEK